MMYYFSVIAHFLTFVHAAREIIFDYFYSLIMNWRVEREVWCFLFWLTTVDFPSNVF